MPIYTTDVRRMAEKLAEAETREVELEEFAEEVLALAQELLSNRQNFVAVAQIIDPWTKRAVGTPARRGMPAGQAVAFAPVSMFSTAEQQCLSAAYNATKTQQARTWVVPVIHATPAVWHKEVAVDKEGEDAA